MDILCYIAQTAIKLIGYTQKTKSSSVPEKAKANVHVKPAPTFAECLNKGNRLLSLLNSPTVTTSTNGSEKKEKTDNKNEKLLNILKRK